MASKRIESVDVAKGIAILSIVVGHVQFFDAGGYDVTGAWLYQFHVPLFFVVAGYFLSDKHRLRAFVAAKAFRLLVPYVLTAGVIVAVAALLQATRGSTWPSVYAQPIDALFAAAYGCGSWLVPTPAHIAPIGALWFLPALFIALVVCRLLLQLKHGLLLTIPIAAVCLVSARALWLPFSIQSAGVATLFVAAGYWLKGRSFLEKKPGPVLLLVCACVFVIAGIYNLHLSFASLISLGNIAFSLVIALSSSVLVLFASRLVDDRVKPLSRVLAWFGRSSLVVLCAHALLLDVGLRTVIATTGLTGNALSAVDLAVQLAVLAACVGAFKHVPGLRRVFY